MDTARVCQQCGSTVSAVARRGLCPGCLANLAGAGASRINGASSASPPGGRSFGDYELLGELAAGGMGVVYLARQVSLKRAVALKMIRSGNLATAAEVQRFRTEAEAAANLDHPHIVPIYEIGEHEGQHYFSMKLIEGGDLGELNAACKTRDTEWLRRSAQLLATMARAVHHAHQRGVLHRDIKPTNILLDEDGQPHLTDFGLAKLAQQGRDVTQTIAILGTPHYMAPEQAAGKAREVTIAADIYSLGAVFFELLAGRPVFEGDSPLEILRKAQETEPPTLRKLNPAVDGDLETICRKCLEKEPRCRYDSSDALSEDLEHWLAGEPIRARAVTRLEQLRKWSHRNPVLATLVVAVNVSLLTGIIGVVSQWRRAEAEADRAKQSARVAETNQGKAEFEAAKSRHVAQFMADMLAGVGPKVALGRDTKLLHEILDNTVERIGKDLKDQPEVEAELRATMAETYLQLGDVVKAEALQRQALRLRRSLFGETNIVTAASLTHLARVLVNRGLPADLSEAEKMAREALAIRTKLLGDQHPEVASTLYVLASALQRQGKLPEAEDTHREALAMRRKFLGEHPETASSLNNLALVMRDRGKKSEAETAIREALAMQKKVLGHEHPDVALSLKNLSAVLRDQAKFAEAETAAREALALQKKVLPPDHPEIGTALARLADVLVQQNKATEAEGTYLELLASKKRLLGEEHAEIAALLNNLSIVLRKKGNIADAEGLDREALAMRRKLFGNEHMDVAHSLDALARTKIEQGNDPEAETLYRESLAIRRKLQGNDHLGVATVLNWLSPVLKRQGKLVEGEALAREALAVRTKRLPPGHPDIGSTVETLADALRRQRKWTEAESIVTDALANRRKLSGDTHPAVPAWLLSLARGKQGERKYSEAEAKVGEAIALLMNIHAKNHREVDNALAFLAELLEEQGKLDEAEAVRREELAMEIALSGADHPFVANSLIKLGTLVWKQRRPAEAETLFREALTIRATTAPDADAAIAQALLWLGKALRDQGKPGEAEPLLREALALRQKAAKPAAVASVIFNMAALLADQERFSEAEERCREALALQRAALEPEHLDVAYTLAHLSRFLLAEQKFAAAEVSARESLNIREKKIPNDWRTFNSRSLLGASLLGQKKYADAEPLLLSGYEGMIAREGSLPADAKLRRNEALQRLVQLYEASGKPDKLAEWKRKLSDSVAAAK